MRKQSKTAFALPLVIIIVSVTSAFLLLDFQAAKSVTHVDPSGSRLGRQARN
jgi:hypothetical protein